MRILIESIPHAQQRYDTAGDWVIEEDGTWRIRISEVEDERHLLLLAFHELVEMVLCRHRGITPDQLDDFDFNWTESEGCHEPGEDQSAPYYREHQFAMGMERLMASELEVNWMEYERTLSALDYPAHSHTEAQSALPVRW